VGISLPFPLCVPSAVYCILLSGSGHFLVSLIWTTSVSEFGVGLWSEGGGKAGDWTGRLIYFPPFQVHSLFFKLTVSVSSSISKELMNSRKSLLVLPSMYYVTQHEPLETLLSAM
jgi:hypothetical protein